MVLCGDRQPAKQYSLPEKKIYIFSQKLLTFSQATQQYGYIMNNKRYVNSQVYGSSVALVLK